MTREGGPTLSLTLVNISYDIGPTEVELDNIVRDNLVETVAEQKISPPSPVKSPAKVQSSEHVKRKYGREQHLDPTAIIGSGEKRTTRSRGDTPKVYQMSLKKAIQSETRDAAIEAAKKELKQLVDLKTWVYLKDRKDASPSVHTRVTPCSMFLKEDSIRKENFCYGKRD